MKKSQTLTGSALALLLAAALASCSSEYTHQTAKPITGLETVVVPDPATAQGRAWDGVVEAVHQATLTAQTNGRVAQVGHDIDDRVTAGAALVHLSAVEQQADVDTARAQLHASKAAMREAEANYRRYQELSQDQHISRSQLEQMHAARDAAIAARDAARAGLASAEQQLEYTIVRAPFDGIVVARTVEPGESVSAGQALMTVFSPDSLRIEVSVPQSDASAIRAAPNATIHFHDGRNVQAGGVTVFPAADAISHAFRVRVDLPMLDPAPAPGTTAKVAFPAVPGSTLVRIPASAVAVRGEVSAVYVLAEGRLSLRQLRLGERKGENVEVIAGLVPGEAVASDPIAARQALVAARGER